MIRLGVVIWMVMMGLALSWGCHRKAAPLSFPSDLNIDWGSGGGGTGLWQGYTLHPDGKIYQWLGRLPKKEEKFLAQLDSTQQQVLWHYIQDSLLMQQEVKLPGNFSRRLEITALGKRNVLIWDESQSENQKLNQFYRLCSDLLNRPNATQGVQE
ncbi:MAG: hypothetical protein KBA26_12205 [Candidatus Delongbacteria bacterium]|nr:hypothetical protein [Candidatus Delongbacteria bacterium]